MRLAALVPAAVLAAIVGASAWAADAPAASAAPAPGAPTAKQLAALCAECAIVNTTVVEKRKGKASGLGAVGGAVAGGVVGKQVGDSTTATVGGAVVGGLLGNEIEKRVKRHKVWVTTVTLKDGRQHKFEANADPGLHAGDVVQIDGPNLRRK